MSDHILRLAFVPLDGLLQRQRPDVMQQEVAVWMNDLVAQRLGYDERSAINDRSGTGRGDGGNMAGAAAGAVEQAPSSNSGRGACEDCIARRHLRAADELRKMIDIGKAEIVRNVLRI